MLCHIMKKCLCYVSIGKIVDFTSAKHFKKNICLMHRNFNVVEKYLLLHLY